MTSFQTTNPYTLQTLNEYPFLTQKELDQKLKKAAKAFAKWKITPFSKRSTLLLKLANLVRQHHERLALLATQEMGKSITEAKAELLKCVGHIEYCAKNGENMLQDRIIPTEASKSVTAYDPIGCIFAIMPWNYPYWQVFRYAAPTIMGGNVTMLKPAPSVAQCALEIEKLFIEAGFPEGVFQTVLVDIPACESIIAADIVQGVTLTGSEAAGASVGALAGKYIKKSVLELGGSDPFIVLNDANIWEAAKVAIQSRMQNAGQACICAKRFIIEERVQDRFIDACISNLQHLFPDNPELPTTKMGPVAKLQFAQNLEKQHRKACKQGAIMEIGGIYENAMVNPTILRCVTPKMDIFKEEVFGPIAVCIVAKDAADAINIANDHRYGLAATIWTKDTEKAYQMARKLDTGNVFVNTMVRSDSRLPFGGVKKSGYGRELADVGLHEFMNLKTIYIN
jgi:succinate-semialdehyde dehydrogenase / glutarate-semialdehyde dehydrogenase